ncbi:MAG TPA: tRNA lysidine(34) synthetase TilS [Ottowia sp.]|uniref:tRNA lysidine(34) synthetase TilS n=1 Tax=Ottowia sp. TaxID=1898956 RepID=UPI002CA5CE5C|nr:tRNA lysidine(34) synthetase TilS [Ottowia sp.]HMN20097.1 tRNA lysidine(34) synthetase TilS [Ottowia sp.]
MTAAPPLAADPRQVDQAMDAFARQVPTLPLAVAFSGGADSTALLLACHERWPGQVVAWHVHHGLQAAADDFERHCQARCRQLDVPLVVRHVDARPAPGQSPEDAARQLRYAAFEQMARAGVGPAARGVAIGQHADDQVETMLLALSRGAGLPGLAAMPMHWRRGALDCWRPLLAVPEPAIKAWLRARREGWIEDPTNADERYTRNRIRARLLPALEAVFPGFRQTFARSAAHAAEAQQLLDELAAQDLAQCGDPPRLAALRALTAARRANLLRHWLRSAHGQIPSSAQLAALQRQLEACRTRGHRIDLRVGQGRVRRVGDVLAWEPPAGRTADA